MSTIQDFLFISFILINIPYIGITALYLFYKGPRPPLLYKIVKVATYVVLLFDIPILLYPLSRSLT